jgi:hypothetical protein
MEINKIMPSHAYTMPFTVSFPYRSEREGRFLASTDRELVLIYRLDGKCFTDKH